MKVYLVKKEVTNWETITIICGIYSTKEKADQAVELLEIPYKKSTSLEVLEFTLDEY